MALGTNGIDVPCSVCDQPDLTPVELACQSLALGGADVNECDVNTLARAVVAQADELAKLRAEVAAYEREIDRIAHGRTIESDAMCVNEVAVCNLRDDNAKLRAALREACDLIAGTVQCESQYDDYTDDPDFKRQLELRRLADGE